MSSRPIWGARTNDRDAHRQGSARLLRTVRGAARAGRRTENIVRLGIAHVPQGRGTFTTMTVEENLQLGAITRKDKDGVVSDIERMYDHFPVLKQRHTQQAGTLSG